MNTTARTLPVLTVLLAACGGGSDDNGSGGQPPVSASFPITASNAQAVSAKSWESAQESASLADLTGTGGFVAAMPGNFTKSGAGASSLSLPALLQKIPFGPETFPCQVSGTVTVSGDLADITTITAGDFINVDSDNCDDGLGTVIDGLLEMTFDAFTGDLATGVYQLTSTLALTNFQATTGDDVETANGAVTVSIDTLSLPEVAASVSGDAFTVDSNAASVTLVNFLSQEWVDTAPLVPPYTLLASGTLDSSELPGSVEYSTPVIFAGQGSNYPDSGELLVVGDDSSARLVALDNVNVRIDIDSDGDGTVDSSIETTWAELAD